MAFGNGVDEGMKVQGDINVTPLVDVCLVLLIIFMVVTPMLQQGVDVLLPLGPHAEKKPGEESDLVISIRQDGSVFLRRNWIPDEDLTRFLKAEYDENPGRAVLLKADARLEFGKVREVMRKATEAQFRQVAILTESQAAR
ncbi:MAG TPA: biopolymer transporter ExbD [Thermoanaerobaculia bacterium]|nr:biopolymer transporter ExbD [Thermoanaerobaculia bacterium]